MDHINVPTLTPLNSYHWSRPLAWGAKKYVIICYNQDWPEVGNDPGGGPYAEIFLIEEMDIMSKSPLRQDRENLLSV